MTNKLYQKIILSWEKKVESKKIMKTILISWNHKNKDKKLKNLQHQETKYTKNKKVKIWNTKIYWKTCKMKNKVNSFHCILFYLNLNFNNLEKQKEEDEENELLDPKSMKNLSF